MGILFFILIFCVVVIAHEFGHMIVAKLNGITVVEFSIGMGPCIFQFTKGGTTYKVRILPLGGACLFEGEDGMNNVPSVEEESDQGDQYETEEFVKNMDLAKTSGAFPDASVGARIATVIAGPIFNFILAFLFATFIIGSYGVDLPQIDEVMEDGAAAEAGIQDGDMILRLNDKKINLYREVSFVSMLNAGEPVDVMYERDGEKYETILHPKYSEEDGRFYLGFIGRGEYVKQGISGTIKYSAYEVKYWIDTTIKSLEMLVRGKVSKDDVAGPVGMAQAVTEVYNESKPSGMYYIWLNMLNFAILLSANLGVLNLLPLPALDGGRLIFLIVEAVRRKPIPPEKEGVVHFAGFILLMLLMVFVLYNDILRLFTR